MSTIVSQKWFSSAMHLKLDDGRKIVIRVEMDDDGNEHPLLRLDGVLLDSEDPEASYADIYAPTKVDIAELMEIRGAVWDQHCRDAAREIEESNSAYSRRLAVRGFR